MDARAWIRFWIDEGDHTLKICDTDNTSKVKSIKNPKKIALFLNAYHLTCDRVKQPAEGPDKFGLFKKKSILDFIPFLRRKRI